MGAVNTYSDGMNQGLEGSDSDETIEAKPSNPEIVQAEQTQIRQPEQ